MALSALRVLACCVWTLTSYAAIPPKIVKEKIEKTAVAYFLENAHPDTGLVLDRAYNFSANPSDNDVSSIAATGFGFAVLANAADRGLLDRGVAQAQILKTLRFARDHVDRYKGWFLHFFDWKTGQRVWESEYSTVDTALFLAGAMYAAQIFPQSEIVSITHQLYLDLDFNDMMTENGLFPAKRTLSMAYAPEYGYTRAEWNMYAEEMILVLMGLGHPTHPLPLESWLAWNRDFATLPTNQRQVMGLGQSLFVHQYSHLFIDFRQYDDGFPNYHQNSVVLTEYQRELPKRETDYKTLREGFWGFSAGEAPGFKQYHAYSPMWHVGTVCIGCVTGSAMFMPREILEDAGDWMSGPYRKKLWGRYGFIDSLDLDQDWFAQVVLGITVGPAYLSLANIDDDTSIWKSFMQIPEIQTALRRATQARLLTTLVKSNGSAPAGAAAKP